MNKLIYEIFDSIIVNSHYDDKADKVIQEEITSLLKPFEQTIDDREYEKLRDTLFSISLTAEKEGFNMGFRFALSLLKNL